MNNMSNKDYVADYLALKVANDQLRERGKLWVWDQLNKFCAEINRSVMQTPDQAGIQVGCQEWNFSVENFTMVGERYGARYRGRTLTVEIGWPKLPEHGYVPDGGLARGRIGFSQNVMLDARPVAEMVFKRNGAADPGWFLISNNRPGEPVTESLLKKYVEKLLQD